MKIFPTTRANVIFAFQLMAHPGENPADSLRAVRAALQAAGVDAVIQQADALADLRECAQRVISAIHADILPNQSAALLAKYSKDWATRRTACDGLRYHFAAPLAGLTHNNQLVDKLVRRHYLCERDRSGAWTNEAIANQFYANVHDVRQATTVLELFADQLERAALDAVEHATAKDLVHA